MSLTLLLTEPNDRNIISPSESDLPPLGQIFFSRLLLSEQQGLPPSQNFGFYMEDTNTGSGRRRAQLLAASPDTCSYFSALASITCSSLCWMKGAFCKPQHSNLSIFGQLCSWHHKQNTNLPIINKLCPLSTNKCCLFCLFVPFLLQTDHGIARPISVS